MADEGAGDLVLTYKVLGERLGITPDSARTKAKRRGWRVVLDNQGLLGCMSPRASSDEPPLRPVQAGDGADMPEDEAGRARGACRPSWPARSTMHGARVPKRKPHTPVRWRPG